VTGSSSFVVVANRLPVDQVIGPDGETTWRRSPGGLVTALEPVLQDRRGTWVGWSGGAADDEPDEPPTFEAGQVRLHRVRISADEIERYYEGFANSSLWPLYHDAVEQPVFKRRWWEAYRVVNERFARAAAADAAPGATVWVQDYQLQLVPAMLRELRPDLRIGFFLHIPFPPVELFMQLPRRTDVLRGLLGADLVGFQRPLGGQNFVQLTRHLLGARTRRNIVEYEGRMVRAEAFPISIDVREMEQLVSSVEVQAREIGRAHV